MMKINKNTVRKCLDDLWLSLDDNFEKEKLYGQQYYRYKNILLALANIKRGGRILEIGSGIGHLSFCIHEFEFKLTCLDFKFDNNKYSKKDPDSMIECDIEREKFPFKDNTFDDVLFTDVIEHLMDDPKVTLSEIRRVLKTNGSLIITTPNVHYFPLLFFPFFGKNVFPIISEYYTSPHQAKHRLVYDRHNRLFTMNELAEIVSAAGFSIAEKKFLACAEPVLKFKGKIAYSHKTFDIKRLFDTDMPKKMFFYLVTKIFPFWRSWIMITAVKSA